ncbi:MAG: hypothetical protein ACFFD4_07525 [Candidatus Odinarchaeota archaeon]
MFRKKTTELTFEEYEGAMVTAWINPPLRVFEQLQSGTNKEIYNALAELIITWNFTDDKDKPLKIEGNSFRNDIPVDLVLKMVEKISAEIGTPKVNRNAI